MAAAQQAQQQSELETAAGNYDLGKALMEEAIRCGLAQAQAPPDMRVPAGTNRAPPVAQSACQLCVNNSWR